MVSCARLECNLGRLSEGVGFSVLARLFITKKLTISPTISIFDEKIDDVEKTFSRRITMSPTISSLSTRQFRQL